jgi:hypothetical protein
MTATVSTTDLQAAPPVVRKLVDWLETTDVPDGLFTEEVFLDFTAPQWRLQARGIDDAVAIRRNGHPAPGRVTRLRYDPTPTGFVLEWEEEWDENGEHWYCREMMRAEVRDGAISDMSVYCTGDWSSARRDRHAREVRLIRP